MGDKRNDTTTCTDSTEGDSETQPPQDERSAIAQEIRELHTTITRLANERERLPQPLFWSLFHNRLNKIRKTKELTRTLAQVLDGIEEND
jgi:TATA-binding protein-associated factor Taf7